MNQLPTMAAARWRDLALVAPAVLAAIIGFWSITVPSLWRDESVTVHFAREPFGAAWREWGEYDAVHAAHYLLVRLTMWVDPVELGLRIPSVIAFVLATLGIGLIGRRLSGTAVGTCASMTYVLLPVSSRYAQEGRSYALVSAAAVFATLALLRLVERPTWGRTAAYAGLVAVLGYLHLYGLLLLVAHGVYVLVSGRTVWFRAAVAWASAGVALVPLVLVAAGQRERQLYWITSPGWSELIRLVDLFGGTRELVVLLGMVAVAGAWFLRRSPLPLLWATLPVAASVAVSQVHPVFTDRYVLFVVPGLALLVGAGVAGTARSLSRGRRPVAVTLMVVALGVVAVMAVPAYRDDRAPAHRSDDLRSLTQNLAESVRAGDVLVPISARYLPFANGYGGPFDRLEVLTPSMIPADVGRVWVVNLGPPQMSRRIELKELSIEFELASVRPFGGTHLSLWTRR